MKTRVSSIARQTRRLRKGVGAAIVVTGAGILVQGALLNAGVLPIAASTVIAAASALAVAMLMAFMATLLLSLLQPSQQPQPVRIAFPAPRPWR